MISRSLLGFCAVTITLAVSAGAQSPTDKAMLDLQRAQAQLQEVQRVYAEQRRSLYQEINKLDDEALNLAKALRTLDREEEQRIARAASLDREVEARKTDFNYSVGILNQYSKAFVTRLHPAENQRYLIPVENADQAAASADDDPRSELLERAKVLELGIERLAAVAGGDRFEGKALRNGNEAVQGTLLVMGPAVYFSQSEGPFEGVGTFADTGTALPTVVALEDPSGGIAANLKSGKGVLPMDGTMGKAIEVAASRETVLETIEKGGYVGHAILGLGLISFLIAGFKVIEITRFKVPSRDTLNGILDDLIRGDRGAAERKAAVIPGDAGELVRTGVERFHEKRRVLEEALFERLVSIKPKLERFLPFLALTAAAGPLMGLLGTVLGIIKTFQAMALYGTGNAKNFSAGISEALITTAEGLIVAIPVLVVHGLLKSLVKAKFGEVEALGIALINGTTERERAPDSNAVSGRREPSDEADDDPHLNPNPA